MINLPPTQAQDREEYWRGIIQQLLNEKVILKIFLNQFKILDNVLLIFPKILRILENDNEGKAIIEEYFKPDENQQQR